LQVSSFIDLIQLSSEMSDFNAIKLATKDIRSYRFFQDRHGVLASDFKHGMTEINNIF